MCDSNTRLLQRVHSGDKEAQDAMVEANMGLVQSTVNRFVGRGTEREDLVQIGVIGLIKAIKRFNESYNVKFSTYAVPMIVGEIRRFMRDDGMIKVSRGLKETAIKGARAKERLSKQFGREPTVNEIAQECGVEPEELAEAFEAVAAPNSIYESVHGGGRETELIDTLSDGDMQEDIINRVFISNILSELKPRERQILVLRYFKGKTQSQIADLIGVSQVQVSRIEKKTVAEIKKRYSQ